MDPTGERTTGTRDEHYNLVSVLYHALHGAENCTDYALDAEATGGTDAMDFFREAGVAQARLAEQAKVLLGIIEAPPEPGLRPEGPAPSAAGTAPLPEEPADYLTPPEPTTPEPTPPVTAPPVVPGAARDPELVFPEEDVVAPGTEPGVPETTVPEETGSISPEDLETTVSVLEGGVVQLETARAVAEVETWERRLEETGDPELQAIAANLAALRGLLTTETDDATAAAPLLSTLGQQVLDLTSAGGAPVADELVRLGELLAGEGRSLSR